MNKNEIEEKIDIYLGAYSQYFPIYTEKYIGNLSEYAQKVYNGLNVICSERECNPLFLCVKYNVIPESFGIVLCDTGVMQFHSEKYESYKNRDDGTIEMFFEKFVEYNKINSMFYKESKLGFFDCSHPYFHILRNDNGDDIPYEDRVGFANNICNFIRSINLNCTLYHN